jgi:pyruvate dehydrogenase E2 component (dihydrolipoamide acetyltransferase)
MPSLGADMEVGTVLEWLVAPGDVVHRGDVVAVVDTAKAAVEVEVFDDGVMGEILVPVGQQVPVGTALAELSPIGVQPEPEPAPAPEPVPVPVREAARAPESAPSSPALPRPPPVQREDVPVASPLVRHLAHQRGLDLRAVPRADPDGAVTRDDLERVIATRPPRSSPYARRRAVELGVDLATVPATGTGGTVRVADVERAAGERIGGPQPVAPAVTPPGAPRAADRQLALRQAIATLMARSKREVPHYYLTQTVDLARTIAWLRDHNRDRPADERVLPAAMLLKAVALAARKHPELNGFWRDGRFEAAEQVNVGVAVALRGGGLVAPAMLAADALPVDDVMAALRELVRSSRAGRLRRRELTDGTITVTNLGDQSAESVHGVVFPPQVALVGFGSITDRPWAVDGLLGVRPLVTATLAADHRATDGHVGGRFLTTVSRLLHAPDELDRGAS